MIDSLLITCRLSHHDVRDDLQTTRNRVAKVMQLMQSPEAMAAWMDERKKEFDALPDDQ